MMRRSKEASGPPGRPETSWLAGAMIGMTITTLAAGAMMLGVGMALGQAAPINRLPVAISPRRCRRDLVHCAAAGVGHRLVGLVLQDVDRL